MPVRSRPEVLAPAGDFDCVRAAVENGADAVYFGVSKFNARARARNFAVEELPELLSMLRLRGVKAYVTFNTLIFSNELDEAEKLLEKIIAAGPDAMLLQDLGVARLVRELAPGFPLHASTQTTTTCPEQMELLRELGFERVVLARELSLAEIRKIKAQTDMPLEVFAHGALCVAYSGQCLTSEALGGRSANRGACAQACRLPYTLIVDGAPRDLGERKYLISPQVSVAVTNFRPFYITGEVNRPGSYEYVDGMTVDQAISLAGGFGYRAARDEVMIKRGGSGAQGVIVSGGQRVSPGDIIEIPERFF